MLDILIPLNLILRFNLNDLLFQLLRPPLLRLDQPQFLLGFRLILLNLQLQAGEHFSVVLLLPPQHIDIILQLMVVRHGIVVGRNGFIQVSLKVFHLGLEHHVVGLAVLLLQLVQPPLLFLVLVGYRAVGILDSEEFPLFLLELTGVVVYLPLQGLQLGL